LSSLRSRILATAVGVPSKVVTNNDLSKIVETSDEWIVTRTGIRQRRFIDRKNGETITTLSANAANDALKRAGLKGTAIDLVIFATATPETIWPSAAARVAGAIGANRAAALDMNAACSGFVYGLHIADGLIRSGLHKRILVLGGEIFSTMMDMTDRATCVLFGDGLGAAVVEVVENADPRKDSMILGSRIGSIFDAEENLCAIGGGSRVSFEEMRAGQDKPYLRMKGQEVFKFATRTMAEVGQEVMDLCGLKAEDVDWLVPHQANLRIIEKVAHLTQFPREKIFTNVDRWGNTSAGTIAICLGEMESQGLLKKGQTVLLDSFGAGYTYGAVAVRW
jgi:3-oxoacyl-[acyl-carrier-protein] synthase-3